MDAAPPQQWSERPVILELLRSPLCTKFRCCLLSTSLSSNKESLINVALGQWLHDKIRSYKELGAAWCHDLRDPKLCKLNIWTTPARRLELAFGSLDTSARWTNTRGLCKKKYQACTILASGVAGSRLTSWFAMFLRWRYSLCCVGSLCSLAVQLTMPDHERSCMVHLSADVEFQLLRAICCQLVSIKNVHRSFWERRSLWSMSCGKNTSTATNQIRGVSSLRYTHHQFIEAF